MMAMPAKTTGPWRTIQEPDLAKWLSQENDEVRELIVECKLPARQVDFERRSDGSAVPVGMTSVPTSDRFALLGQLSSFLESVVQRPTTVLKAAGVIAVKATRQEVLRFVDHPLVKAIEPNRRLR